MNDRKGERARVWWVYEQKMLGPPSKRAFQVQMGEQILVAYRPEQAGEETHEQRDRRYIGNVWRFLPWLLLAIALRSGLSIWRLRPVRQDPKAVLRAALSAHFGQRTVAALERAGQLCLEPRQIPGRQRADGLVLYADQVSERSLLAILLRNASEAGGPRLETMLGEEFAGLALRFQQLMREGQLDRELAAKVDAQVRQLLRSPSRRIEGEAARDALCLACFLELRETVPAYRVGRLAAALHDDLLVRLRHHVAGMHGLPRRYAENSGEP